MGLWSKIRMESELDSRLLHRDEIIKGSYQQ